MCFEVETNPWGRAYRLTSPRRPARRGRSTDGHSRNEYPNVRADQKGTLNLPAGTTSYERIDGSGSLAAYIALARQENWERRARIITDTNGHRSPSRLFSALLCHVISAAKHRKRCHPATCAEVSYSLSHYNLQRSCEN